MQLRTDTDKKLSAWLGPHTWNTHHALDMRRFFDFVDAYEREHGHSIDEPALQEEITRRVIELHDYAPQDGPDKLGELSTTIRSRVSLAYEILDFLKQTGR